MTDEEFCAQRQVPQDLVPVAVRALVAARTTLVDTISVCDLAAEYCRHEANGVELQMAKHPGLAAVVGLRRVAELLHRSAG